MSQEQPLATRAQFHSALRAALAEGRGFATGKLGNSAIARLNYPIIAAHTAKPQLLKVVEPSFIHHNLKESALFPADVNFYLAYNDFYAAHLQNLDYLGVFPDMLPRYRPLLAHYHLTMPRLSYLDQEPDRSSPSQEANCYLPLFQDRKILLVTSCADFLRQRATAQCFEAVWQKTGKRWFHPAAVDALEFPTGYAASTHAHYANSLEQFDAIASEMARRDFDVALIAAAGLAVPLASHAKTMGKVAIDLGGHLQVLFGVLGQRWRQLPEWQAHYVNEWWVDMPDHYRPPERNIADQGAYW